MSNTKLAKLLQKTGKRSIS